MTYPSGWYDGYNPNLGTEPPAQGWTAVDGDPPGGPGVQDSSLVGSPPDAALELEVTGYFNGVSGQWEPADRTYSLDLGSGSGQTPPFPEEVGFGLTIPPGGMVAVFQRVKGRGYAATTLRPEGVYCFSGGPPFEFFPVDLTVYHDFIFRIPLAGSPVDRAIVIDGTLLAEPTSDTVGGQPTGLALQLFSPHVDNTPNPYPWIPTSGTAVYDIDYMVWRPLGFTDPRKWWVGVTGWGPP